MAANTVQLRAGTSTLATATNSVIPGQGQFGEVVLSYVTNGTESGPLAIRLLNNGTSNQVHFDNVTLDETSLVPEPASMVLLGAGLAALGLYRRRRQVTR